MKRGFDIVFSFIGLLLLMPLFAVITVLIKLYSRGPVFIIQKRIGRNFKPFNLYKFRTMVTDAPEKGLQITAGGAPGITGIGKYLRKTKLDELPQLINTLKGEMSFVGPRPEVEKYVNKYRKEYEDILKVRPGIMDVASLAFSNEEEILKERKDPEEYYIHVLLPEKIGISREYVTNASLTFDIKLIFITLFKRIYPSGFIKKTIAFLTPYRKPIVVGVQSIIFIVSNYLAFSIRFDGAIGPSHLALFVGFIPLLLLIRITLLFMFSMDKGLWRYVSLEDFLKMGSLVTLGTIVFFVTVRYVFGYSSYPISIYFIDWCLNMLFLGGIRAMRRLNRANKNGHKFHISGKKRLVVIGAGDAAEMFIRDTSQCSYYAYRVVGLIDDNPNKKGLKIRDIPILGTRKDLKDVLRSEQVDELLIAMPAAPRAVFKEVVKDIKQHALPIKTLPSLWNLLNGKESSGSIKPVEPEDVLFRPPLSCSSAGLKSLIKGKRVMVTGAGGSIGSELSRQILSYNPKNLILFERHEESLFKIDGELRSSLDSCPVILTSIIGDILDEERVGEVMEKYHPQIVFHAAAYKHVPLMEDNPYEAFKTNVIGTKIMAEKSGEFGVERFVMISTDKAVNSVNVMGMTKKIAEDMVRAFMEERDVFTSTKYMIVRFGNVLGSSGSVVPLFREQIKNRGPVTVTHPDITRYFMTIPEAVNLVLQASVKGDGGEILVLDMGEPVKILDLAKRMISLYGYKPGVDIDITFTGLRPGEKLYEELFSSDEIRETTSDAKIMMAIPGQSNRYVFETLKTLNFDNVRDKDDIAYIYSKLANGLRDHKRLNLPLELSYYTDGRDRIGFGILNNISIGGFSSKLKQYFASGEKMDIRISTNRDDVRMDLDTPAEVVWSRKASNGYKYGFKFTHTGEDQVKILRDYIESVYKLKRYIVQ